jgi:hypothetical protein
MVVSAAFTRTFSIVIKILKATLRLGSKLLPPSCETTILLSDILTCRTILNFYILLLFFKIVLGFAYLELIF